MSIVDKVQIAYAEERLRRLEARPVGCALAPKPGIDWTIVMFALAFSIACTALTTSIESMRMAVEVQRELRATHIPVSIEQLQR